LILHAPAKINLALHITGQREDGYHTLESLTVFAKIGDQIEIVPSAKDEFFSEGPFGFGLAGGVANLVEKAREVLRQHAGGRPCPPVAIRLTKNLPVASGIGGGSADAAATLHGLNALWQLDLTHDDLTRLSLLLGADVPMCVYGTPLIAKGIGEVIEPIETMPPLHLLLVNPGIAVSTPAIFNALTTKQNAALPALLDKSHLESLHSWIAWLLDARNDLEPPALALYPLIADVLRALRAHGASVVRMSGSGATCFGLFETSEALDAARGAIALNHPQWWVA
jgi:4-diphosphocytidyl-2-C-methyl-D-erythritol kinase